MTNFKTSYKKIGTLTINKDYSLSGKSLVIKLSENDNKLSVQSISNILKLANLEEIKTVKQYYSNFFQTINLTSSLNYSKLIGSKKSKEYFNYLQSKISEAESMVTNYHTDLFSIRKKCYSKFEQVLYEGSVLEKPVYVHYGVTGRTKIKKGFNFLTLKKEKKNRLKPSKENMCLVEVDFKSCEPYFYLKSQGIDVNSSDVYMWLCKKYDIPSKNRDNVKRGILSMIYGANENIISRIMQTNISTIKKIKEELGLYELEKNLKKYYSDHGHFLNYYGRPITSDNNVINYYIQSSAVDFCSFAFYEFCNSYGIKPSFFVHDSMTFQCTKEKLKKLLEIKQIKDSYSNIEIPIEFTVLHQ